MQSGRLASAAGAALLLWSASAQAHLASTGLGPVYDGISHFFLSLDDLLPVLAMALLAGLNGPVGARRSLFALPAAWIAGGMAGFYGGAADIAAGVTALLLLVLGTLVAVDRKLVWFVIVPLACALGLWNGWFNGTAIAVAGREAIALVGMGGAVLVLMALTSALVLSLRSPWARISVRVAGSWIAATGLLMLGWSLSGRA